jgi:putative tryptophan/tyrosine transport system substrate-binding protein
MRRREFITILGSAAAWVSTALAQDPRRVIGVLGGFIGSSTFPGALPAFFEGLKETGFIEGKNLGVEFRWADGHYDRLPSLAAELVGRNVGVIYAIGVSGQGSDQDDPDCLLDRHRSGQGWSCCKFRPTDR